MAKSASSLLLFPSNDVALWGVALDAYSTVMQKKAAEKGKSSKSKTKELLELDNWYQEELPKLIASRIDPHLTQLELCKLMKWKLTRGKFRPRLTELVKENKPEEVETITKTAFLKIPSTEAAIKHLCQLKAVGPATASAILCAYSSTVPFMADESVLSVPGLGKLEYNLKHYMSYVAKIQDKVEQLNMSAGEGKDSPWTSHDVEKALWTHHLAPKYSIPIHSRSKDKPSTSKRPLLNSATPPAKKKK